MKNAAMYIEIVRLALDASKWACFWYKEEKKAEQTSNRASERQRHSQREREKGNVYRLLAKSWVQ